MKELIIKSKYINSDLTPGESMLLTIVYTQNKLFFKHFLLIHEDNTRIALNSLEKKLYIKITGEEFEDIILREKSNTLFMEKSIEKDIDEVINYLNTKLNKPRGFSLKSKGNRRFISARLNDGYTLEDLKKVIDVKYNEWSGTAHEFYLRPETLFNETKMSSYIMQAATEDSNSIDIFTEKV